MKTTEKHILDEPVSTTVISHRFSHVVWGSVFAGVVMVMVTQLALTLLGSSIGLTAVNVTEENGLKALGVGAIFWWILSGMIAFYCGGWISGRMSGIPRRMDGGIHGLLTWGVSTLIMAFILTSTLGAITAGALGLLKSGGQAAASAAPSIMTSLENSTGAGSVNDINTDIQNIVRRGSQDPTTAGQIMNAVTGMVTASNPNDHRQEVVTLLTQKTNLSEAEANAAVDRWTQNINIAKQKAKDAAQTTTKAAGMGALASFLMLALGALVGGLGGSFGAPHWSEQEIA